MNASPLMSEIVPDLHWTLDCIYNLWARGKRAQSNERKFSLWKQLRKNNWKSFCSQIFSVSSVLTLQMSKLLTRLGTKLLCFSQYEISGDFSRKASCVLHIQLGINKDQHTMGKLYLGQSKTEYHWVLNKRKHNTSCQTFKHRGKRNSVGSKC